MEYIDLEQMEIVDRLLSSYLRNYISGMDEAEAISAAEELICSALETIGLPETAGEFRSIRKN